jgi:hypothetical protein
MYPTRCSSVSNKRKQKENRAKSKKRKLARQDVNFKRVLSFITSPDSYMMLADVWDINFNNVSIIDLKDAKWLKTLVQQNKFTERAWLKMKPLLLSSVLKVINNGDERHDTDGVEMMKMKIYVLLIVRLFKFKRTHKNIY